MSKGRRLSDHVAWSSVPVPLWRLVLRRVPTAVGVSVDLLTPGSAPSLGDQEPVNPRMPSTLDEPVGHVSVGGRGAGMPSAYPARQVVTIYQDRATIRPGLHELTLPLQSLRLVQATPSRLRWSRRKAADTNWSLQAAGPGVSLDFRGRWLLLAQLGTLASWPEPA